MKKEYKIFMLYSFFSSAVFTRGVFIAYLLQVKGLTLLEIATFQSIYMISSSLFQVPTGVFADKYGKSKSLIIGAMITALINLAIIFVSGSYVNVLFIIASFEALGRAFSSGTDNALFFELLDNEGVKDKYIHLHSKIMMISSIITGLSILIGGFISEWSWNFLYLATSAMYFLSLIMAVMLQKYEKHKPIIQLVENKSKKRVLKFYQLHENILFKPVWIFVATIFSLNLLDGLLGSYFNINQIILENLGISNRWIGIFFSALYLVGASAYPLTARFKKRYTSSTLTIIILSLMLISFMGILFIDNRVLFLLFTGAICLLPEMLYTLTDNAIQMNIKSNFRATILSAFSIINSMASAISYLFLGVLIGNYGFTTMFTILAIIIAIHFSLALFVKLKFQKAL